MIYLLKIFKIPNFISPEREENSIKVWMDDFIFSDTYTTYFLILLDVILVYLSFFAENFAMIFIFMI